MGVDLHKKVGDHKQNTECQFREFVL